jgi:hypothetical protein
MDENIKRISEWLSVHSSRRGFSSTMGKMVLGVTAIITGRGLFPLAAEATPACCTNGGAGTCSSNRCPGGSSVRYTWRCGQHNGHYYVCHDCKTSSGHLVCVYATYH